MSLKGVVTDYEKVKKALTEIAFVTGGQDHNHLGPSSREALDKAKTLLEEVVY